MSARSPHSSNMPERTSAGLILRMVALLWLFIVLGAALFAVRSLSEHPPASDIRALLPDSGSPSAEQVLRQRWTRAHENQLTLLVERPSADAASLRADAAVLEAHLAALASSLEPVLKWKTAQAEGPSESVIRAAAGRGMTLADEAAFGSMSVEALGAAALTAAAMPVGGGTAPFAEDPQRFGLRWAAERASSSPLIPVGRVFVMQGGSPVLAAFFEAGVSPMTEGELLRSASDQLLSSTAAIFPGGPKPIFTGLALFTSHAAATAVSELSLLGGCSLLAVVLLALFWFGRLRVLGMMLLVTLSSFATATAAVIAATGELHLVTLVFGTTLIGITVDYSAHYFCQRLGRDREKQRTLRLLLPNLGLAFASSALAFGAMALAPLPGLRQMAVFGASGIAAAFACVVLWLPLLEDRPGVLLERTARMAGILEAVPSIDGWRRPLRIGLLIVLAAAGLAGSSGLRLTSSLYELNNAPAAMIEDAKRAGELLRSPSLSQYFLVEASNDAERLEREEALERALFEHRSDPRLLGVELLSESDWHASPSRQRAIDALRLETCRRTNVVIEPMLGASLGCLRPSTDSAPGREVLDAVLPPAMELNGRSASLVLVTGLHAGNVGAVASLARGLPGVVWHDLPAEISQTLSLYRDRTAGLLAVGFAVIAGILTVRFRREAWRAFGPTALALFLTAGVLGIMGESLSLFTVLAGVLLVGLGIDYGIFLTAEGGDSRTFAAVLFAGLTTMASFGLLALSETPALRSFGLTVAVGETLILVLTPWLRRRRTM